MVGGGFAGFHAARALHRRLGTAAEIVPVNPTDYFLYVGGSVNRLLPIPGVAEHAHGFRNLAEAVRRRRGDEGPVRGGGVPSAGFEPATHGLGNRCSIP